MSRSSIASAGLAAACILLAALPESLSTNLAWQREALLAGEWWRLWTGHLVHFSVQHTLCDAVVLLVAGTVFERGFGTRRLLGSLALAAPMISVLLLGAPSLDEFRGASGIGSLLACGAALVLWERARRWRTDILVAAAGCASYMLWQACAGAAAPALEVAVAWQAQVAGAACGLVAVLHHQLFEYLTSRYESGPGVHGRL